MNSSHKWPLPVFGLTGSIASGKSELARQLGFHGAVVIDADAVGHGLLARGRNAWRAVTSAFGPGILGPDGRIDRDRLGIVVFADAEARAKLEAIMHPAIARACRRRVERLARDRFAVVVLEAALLVEAGMDRELDGTIVVLASSRKQVERLVFDRGLEPAQARARVRAQRSGRWKASHADWVVRNDGSLDELRSRARELWRELGAHPAVRRGRARRIACRRSHGTTG